MQMILKKSSYPHYSPRRGNRSTVPLEDRQGARSPPVSFKTASFSRSSSFSLKRKLNSLIKSKSSSSHGNYSSNSLQGKELKNSKSGLLTRFRQLSARFRKRREIAHSESSGSFSIRSFHQAEFNPEGRVDETVDETADPSQAPTLNESPAESEQDDLQERQAQEKSDCPIHPGIKELEEERRKEDAAVVGQSDKEEPQEEIKDDAGAAEHSSASLDIPNSHLKKVKRLSAESRMRNRDSFESTSSKGSFFLSRLDAFDALGTRSLVYEDLNTQIESLMEVDALVTQVREGEVEDADGDEDDEAVKVFSGMSLDIDGHDTRLGDSTEIEENFKERKEKETQQDEEDYKRIKERLNHLFIHQQRQELTSGFRDSSKAEDDDSDKTLGGGEMEFMEEEDAGANTSGSVSRKLILSIIAEEREEAMSQLSFE